MFIISLCLRVGGSRFTKNLSADKINLSTFKGEGELSNLELNEIVLTDLLELPSWLRLTSAWCNKVTFRIQWTKLKNVPICLVNRYCFQKIWWSSCMLDIYKSHNTYSCFSLCLLTFRYNFIVDLNTLKPPHFNYRELESISL